MPKLLSVRVKDADGYTHHVAHDVDEKTARAMAAGLEGDGQVELVDQSGKVVDKITDTKARRDVADEQAKTDIFAPDVQESHASAMAPVDHDDAA